MILSTDKTHQLTSKLDRVLDKATPFVCRGKLYHVKDRYFTYSGKFMIIYESENGKQSHTIKGEIDESYNITTISHNRKKNIPLYVQKYMDYLKETFNNEHI